VFVIKISSFGQIDSLQNAKPNRSHRYFREKSSSILIGVHLQNTKDLLKNDYQRKYIEIGLHKTILTDVAVFTHGPSLEVSPWKGGIVGLKYGAWTNPYFFSLGLSTIYYTNFQSGSFIIRPEWGIAINRYRIAMGHNLKTFPNEGFNDIKEAKIQVILNVLLKWRRQKVD